MGIKKIASEHKHPEDQVEVYLNSIKTLFVDKENPYLKDLDTEVVTYRGEVAEFNKIKYPPLQIFSYAPLALLAGINGILTTQLLLYFMILATVFHDTKEDRL
jgi:hypothetical protein